MLIVLLFTVYAVLDGFDAGVGVWYLFLPEENRRLVVNKIGRFWYGNKAWLFTGGGALFVAFPELRDTVFGSFYPAVILVIGALILRAAAIELRNIVDNRFWVSIWDIAYAGGGIILPLVFGLAVGNILKGLPLDRNGNYLGSFPRLLSHYSIAVGLTGIIMFATQNSLYLAYKSDGIIRKKALEWVRFSWMLYLILFMDLTIWSISVSPYISVNFKRYPPLFLVPVCGLASIIFIPFLLKRGKIFAGFLSSTVSVVVMMFIFGISIFPNFIPASGFKPNSLTIYNSSASEKTLLIMLAITPIVMPLLILYTVYIHRDFRK